MHILISLIFIIILYIIHYNSVYLSGSNKLSLTRRLELWFAAMYEKIFRFSFLLLDRALDSRLLFKVNAKQDEANDIITSYMSVGPRNRDTQKNITLNGETISFINFVCTHVYPVFRYDTWRLEERVGRQILIAQVIFNLTIGCNPEARKHQKASVTFSITIPQNISEMDRNGDWRYWSLQISSKSNEVWSDPDFLWPAIVVSPFEVGIHPGKIHKKKASHIWSWWHQKLMGIQ